MLPSDKYFLYLFHLFSCFGQFLHGFQFFSFWRWLTKLPSGWWLFSQPVVGKIPYSLSMGSSKYPVSWWLALSVECPSGSRVTLQSKGRENRPGNLSWARSLGEARSLSSGTQRGTETARWQTPVCTANPEARSYWNTEGLIGDQSAHTYGMGDTWESCLMERPRVPSAEWQRGDRWLPHCGQGMNPPRREVLRWCWGAVAPQAWGAPNP